MDYSLIPDDLKEVRRWLLWRSIPRTDSNGAQKKPSKVPYYTNGKARNGELDTPEDYINLVCFNDALTVLDMDNHGYYAGLGFAFGRDDSGNYWQGIDFDKISLHHELESLICDLPGYTEESPSGDGVHAIGYGEKFTPLGSNKSGIEAYSYGRFFTVTGKALKKDFKLECLKGIVDEKLVKLHSSGAAAKPQSYVNNYKPSEAKINEHTIPDLRSALNYIDSDDRECWIKIGMCLKADLGEDGRELFMEWSKKSDKFDPVYDSKTWYGFKPNNAGISGIFKDAVANGWENESSKRARDRKEKNKDYFKESKKEDDKNEDKKENEKQAQPFKLISCDELMGREFKPDWLIQGYIERKALCLVFGNSASGKSLIVQDMCFCIGNGIPFKGKKVKQGNVVYVAGEGFNGFQKRFKALSIHYGRSVKNVHFSEQSGDFMSMGSAYDVSEAVKAVGNVALVVIDTMHRNMTGDENSAQDMAQFFQNIDQFLRPLDVTIIIIHHSGHDTKERSRGSSSIRAAMDAEFQVTKDDMLVTLTNTKMKDYDPPDPLELKIKVIDTGSLCDEGLPITSIVLDGDGGGSTILKGDVRIVFDALKFGMVSNGVECRDGVIGLDIKNWRKIAYADLDGSNKPRDFGKAMEILVKELLVFVIDGYMGDTLYTTA